MHYSFAKHGMCVVQLITPISGGRKIGKINVYADEYILQFFFNLNNPLKPVMFCKSPSLHTLYHFCLPAMYQKIK